MKKKLKLAFEQLEMDMDILSNAEIGQYIGGTGSIYNGGEAFYDWYINGGYEYGGSAAYFFANGAGGSENRGSDDTEFWIWSGTSWVWMGTGTPDANAPHYGADLPNVVVTANGNSQSVPHPYQIWYDWIMQGGYFGGSGNGSGNSTPTNQMNASSQLATFIADAEDPAGFHATVFDDGVGNLTIGYGHKLTAAEIAAGTFANRTLSEPEAMEIFQADISTAVNQVRSKVNVQLTQNQFDALVSFTYNVGTTAFANSTLLTKLNTGDYAGAANEFAVWINAGGQQQAGLVIRRAQEKELFTGSGAGGGYEYYD